jgi:hypothetical protein
MIGADRFVLYDNGSSIRNILVRRCYADYNPGQTCRRTQYQRRSYSTLQGTIHLTGGTRLSQKNRRKL